MKIVTAVRLTPYRYVTRSLQLNKSNLPRCANLIVVCDVRCSGEYPFVVSHIVLGSQHWKGRAGRRMAVPDHDVPGDGALEFIGITEQ